MHKSPKSHLPQQLGFGTSQKCKISKVGKAWDGHSQAAELDGAQSYGKLSCGPKKAERGRRLHGETATDQEKEREEQLGASS